jgi:hypothetical protein
MRNAKVNSGNKSEVSKETSATEKNLIGTDNGVCRPGKSEVS